MVLVYSNNNNKSNHQHHHHHHRYHRQLNLSRVTQSSGYTEKPATLKNIYRIHR